MRGSKEMLSSSRSTKASLLMGAKKDDRLHQLFLKGTLPKGLDGFYQGKLLTLIPANFVELLGSIVSKFWLPWYGKEFYNEKQRGDNLLPFGIHIFPFQTRIKGGLKDDIRVMQLDYNIAENPRKIRDGIDELVCVGRNKYLGKAYLKDGNDYRLVAFFSLEK